MAITETGVLKALETLGQRGIREASARQILAETGGSLPTLIRRLTELIGDRKVRVSGRARATRYALAPNTAAAADVETPSPAGVIPWSQNALQVIRRLQVPRANRAAVSYQRAFLDGY